MKVLLYNNRKIDPIILDASTPVLEEAALQWLFQYLDKDWRVYDSDLSPKHARLYASAKQGDVKATRELLTRRLTYEYEYWSWNEVIDPTDESRKKFGDSDEI